MMYITLAVINNSNGIVLLIHNTEMVLMGDKQMNDYLSGNREYGILFPKLHTLNYWGCNNILIDKDEKGKSIEPYYQKIELKYNQFIEYGDNFVLYLIDLVDQKIEYDYQYSNNVYQCIIDNYGQYLDQLNNNYQRQNDLLFSRIERENGRVDCERQYVISYNESSINHNKELINKLKTVNLFSIVV